MRDTTKLSDIEYEGLREFGDTGFYLQFDAHGAQRYKILDGTHDEYNTVFTTPLTMIPVVQEVFDAFYTGYKYGENRGEYNGRMELQREMRLLLNM